jgi:hypothetical protein
MLVIGALVGCDSTYNSDCETNSPFIPPEHSAFSFLPYAINAFCLMLLTLSALFSLSLVNILSTLSEIVIPRLRNNYNNASASRGIPLPAHEIRTICYRECLKGYTDDEEEPATLSFTISQGQFAPPPHQKR